MATSKAKSGKKSVKNKAHVTTVKSVDTVEAKKTKKEDTAEVKVETKAIVSKAPAEKPSKVKTFFARKGDANENILTIFKDTRIIPAMIGEAIGTALFTSIALTLGLFNPLYMVFGYLGITMLVFKLSGAHLNPAITAGMMASRRVSAIRGFLYIVSQVIGAWLAFMIINAFVSAGVAAGNLDADVAVLPALTHYTELDAATDGFSYFGSLALLEFLGTGVIAFAYARSVAYKKSPLTVAAMLAGAVFCSYLFAVLITSTCFGIQDSTFVFNPATAMMYGVFPTSAEGFDVLMNLLMPMLCIYVLVPMIAGIVAFFVSDLCDMSAGEELTA